MEAAMVRMQGEIASLVNENNDLKHNLHHSKATHIKHKKFSEQYTHDLSVTKKKLAELEARFATTEKDLKKTTKVPHTAMCVQMYKFT
jgi:hypothetical protein